MILKNIALSVLMLAIVANQAIAASPDEDKWRSLIRQGSILLRQGELSKAESTLQEAGKLAQVLNKPYFIVSTNITMANIVKAEGRTKDAEQLLQDNIALIEKQLSDKDILLCETLRQLAEVYIGEKQYADAATCLKRALSISDALDNGNKAKTPHTCMTIEKLAAVYEVDKKPQLAEPLLVRTTTLIEKEVGPDNPELAKHLSMLAQVYAAEHKWDLAETTFNKASETWKKTFGPNNVYSVRILENQASMYINHKELKKAEACYQQAIAMIDQSGGEESIRKADVLEKYAELLKKLKRNDDATKLNSVAHEIRKLQASVKKEVQKESQPDAKKEPQPQKESETTSERK